MAYSTGQGPLLAFSFLGLLTVSDGFVTNALQSFLSSSSPQPPGYWNLGTTALLISTASDLVGQLVLGVTADLKGRKYAMYLNASAILMSSVCSALSLLSKDKWPLLASVLAPLLKLPGGGSHATAFFTLVLLQDQVTGPSRVALIYITGAVSVICQAVASLVTPILIKHNHALPYILSIVFCLLGYVVAINSANGAALENIAGNRDLSTAEPLIPRTTSRGRNFTAAASVKELRIMFDIFRDRGSATRRSMLLLWLIFFTAAISKATRPLFTTYIQHRVGIKPHLAQQLWSLRTILSIAIFSTIFPALILSQRTLAAACQLALSFARYSIILMLAGAFVIGFAQSVPVLVAGLIVNTLGVAVDLSLMGFASGLPLDDIAGRCFTFIASLESFGTLLGICVLYPIYQFHLDDSTAAGGTPYYLCGALYILVAVVIWSI